MIPFASIAGGRPSSAKGLTAHLVNNTLSQDEAKLAAYYSKGGTLKPDCLFEDVARQVAAGDVDFGDAVDLLLADWLAKHPVADDATQTARDAKVREITGSAQRTADALYDLGMARVDSLPPGERNVFAQSVMDEADRITNEGWAQAERFMDAALERDEKAVHDAEGRIISKLDAKVYALQEGVVDAPIAVVRAGADPRVLIGLGIEIDRPLKQSEIDALLSGHRADGERVEGKVYAQESERVDKRTHEVIRSGPIGSYDFAPAPGKDISIVWGLGTEHERGLIMDAHIESSRVAVGYIAKHIGVLRLGDGGEDGTEPGHVVWLEFTHHTSRRVQMTQTVDGVSVTVDSGMSGDMDIHTHFLIPNAVFGESGKVGSLDTAALAGLIFEADELYHAEFAQRLRESGFDAGLDEKTGAARIWSVSDKLRTLFSKRTNAGEKLARQWTADRGEAWDNLSDAQRAKRMKVATQDVEQKTKGGKDDQADFAGWRQQAESTGWKPHSFQLYGPPERQLEGPERHRAAYEHLLPHLAKKFEHEAVLTGHTLRAAALRSLVKFGYSGLEDVAAVTRLMWKEGVQQFGEKTALAYGQEPGARHVAVTTVLHENQEREFVELGKRAAADRGNAVPRGLLRKNLKESGLDLSDDHGKALQKSIERVGTQGKFAVIIAAAGAGKTEGLKPLVKTWHQRGHDVWASSLAHEQTDDLVKTGIPQYRVKPVSLLLESLEATRRGETDYPINLTKKSIVVVDEFVLLGTRQGLELLRHRDRIGFSLVLLGDEKQCEGVEAGDITDLSYRVLGKDAIPVIETTKRQQTDEEKMIVGLIRDGKPGDALDIKRSNGDAELAPGGRDGTIARVAELYVHYLKRDGEAPNINVPTNADAHAVSVAVREERRKLGLVDEKDLTTRAATDGERDYTMALAKGDRVRLFKSTATINADGKRSTLGRNKSRMEVVDATAEGLTVKNERTGRVGTIEWKQLDLNQDGRMHLAYADAQTVHTAQGSSCGTQISALINGSQAISGGMGYSMMTRHYFTSHLVTNGQAEETAVRKSRPLNSPHPTTNDDKWAMVAKAFLQRPQDSATKLRARVTEMRRGAVVAFQKAAAPAFATKGPAVVQEKGLAAALRPELEWLQAMLGQSVSQGWQAAQHVTQGWHMGR